MKMFRLKILLKLYKWLKERQYRKSKRRLENSIVALHKFDYFLSRSGISRQERREFWREFGSNETKREDILRKICTRMGLKDFDKLTRNKVNKEKHNGV